MIRKVFLGLMIAMPVISFGLGCWQVNRLQWKNGLIALCENNLSRPEMDGLPRELTPDNIDQFQYRRFKSVGHFHHDQEMFVGPRMRNGAMGYLVVTPFTQKDGKKFLVQRGWIAKEKVVPTTRDHGYLKHLAIPQSETEITGVVRCNLSSDLVLLFDHEKDTRLFHTINTPLMAAQLGTPAIFTQVLYDMSQNQVSRAEESSRGGWFSWLFNRLSKTREFDRYDPTLEYLEFEFVEQGVPIGIHPKISYPNNHAQYLVTWFGLSFFSSGLLAYTFWKSKNMLSAEKILEAKRRNNF